MIFLGIAIPIGILLGLLLFFSGLYSRNRLAAAASGGLDMFTTNFENQLDSVENYLLNLSLNDATFRSLSEQTDRTRAYLDAYEIAQGFPAVLAANDTLMGVVLRSGSGNLYVGRYGAAAQQLKQKLNLEAYLGQPGQTNKMMTKGWYLRTIGQRLYLLRSVFYQKASLLRQEAEVMLCDIEMPMESGLDLLDWLRQRGMTTRCIFLTAHAEFRYAQEALRLGGFDYIMQPAPYEQVANAVSRALENVKEERAALELQSRGAVFDDQKKEIVETMLRGFLLGNAPGSSLTAFEELSLVPRRERECWVALMQPLRWKQGEEPWELSLLSTAVGNMSSEVFTPLQVLSVTVAIPAEQCLVLVLQSRVGEPLEADYITRQLNYLQSACAQYIHCEAAFYPEGPQPFEQASEIYQKLLQQRSENVALKGGILLGRPAEKVPEVFRIPQIGAWQKLLQAGCAQAMEQEACQLLDKLTVNNQLNSQTLRYFYQDFMQMLFSFPEKKRQGDMFREPEALELYRNGMKTVPDMKALVHYVASVWDNETEESSQSTVEIIMAYIAEHLENELRREELADAVHLNPDYMARLFKKETGMNLKDYIIQQKMQEAQSLLCTTNLPISLIAAKVGYTNFGHFSTSYKKFYHKTPQEERSAAL